MKEKEGTSTRSIHTLSQPDPATRAINPPMYDNASFAYTDIDEMRAAALHQVPGHIYSRNTNPTIDLFEAKIAALEGAERGTAFATGMGAIHSTLFALLSPGKRAVSVKDSYGATYLHFTQIMPRFGIDCEVCETEDSDAIIAAMDKGCDLLYLENSY